MSDIKLFSPVLNQHVRIVLYTFLTTALISIVILGITNVFTNVRYRIQIGSGKHHTRKIRQPARIPYTLPFLGHALSFLSKQPGVFWSQLMQWHPRTTGACTLMLGGRNLHVLFDSHATQALFKAREPNRDKLTTELLMKAFGLDEAGVKKFSGYGEPVDPKLGRTPRAEQDRINQEYLLKTDRVNELTAQFIRAIKKQLPTILPEGKDEVEVDLYTLVRKYMFIGTTESLFGTVMLEDCPKLEEDFFIFDEDMLTCFFGVPRWISPKPYKARENLHVSLIRHQELNEERTKRQTLDPDGDTAWDPIQGSRWVRARQRYYQLRDLSVHDMGLNDLGLLFGVASNAIPAAGWMLIHILDPRGDKTLYPRIMEQVLASQQDDGSFNMSVLANQPLLLSIFHEVLRLYVDVLVARDLPADQILPIGSSGEKVLLVKDSTVMAPSWLAHRDESYWPDASKFWAERWLSTDPETGNQIFTTRESAGRFFPFGGGKGYCPGRIFSKQEIFAFIAIVLTEFQFEGLSYVDKHGAATDSFPDLSKVYPGPAMMVMEGDLRVRVQRRT